MRWINFVIASYWLQSLVTSNLLSGTVWESLSVSAPPASSTVAQLFAPFGTVASVRIQQGKKYGFVSMPHYNEVVNAINNLNGMTLRSGVTLQVRMATADATKNQ